MIGHRVRVSVFAAAFGLLASFSAPNHARAQGQADGFYKGKTLEIYVGYGPGGGYDLYTRTLAKHIVKHLPGRPGEPVVRNMPGAGSAKLATYMWEVAPKDGTAFGLINSTIAFDPLFGGEAGEAIKFDPSKLTWIGSLDQFTPIGISWYTTGVKSIEDIKKKEFISGSTGGQDAATVYCTMLNNMIGTKFKVLAGYKGSNDIALAMERGELPGFVGWYWAGLKAFKPDWVRDGKMNVFLQFGLERDPDLPGVPHVTDVPNDEQKQIFRLVLSQLALARPFIAPPGVPAERVKELRAAFNATAKDPEFLADMEKAKQTVRLYTGEQIDKLLKEVYSTPPAMIEKVKAAMTVPDKK
jgi:tripartite-type tricarboxylate transporter receptor subunit TctC